MLACVYPAESFRSRAVTVLLRQEAHGSAKAGRPKLVAVKERAPAPGHELPVGGGGAVLVLSELESMAARQQREIAQQRRLLEQREAKLAVLRGAQEPAQQDRLARLRHRLDQQQSKLNRLRLLRSQTDASRANNATLTSDLDCIRALFNEKEKELSLAVAKVEELTRQLEDLRGRHNGPGQTGHLGTPASAELDKLRRELLYRNKMNEQQNQVVSQQRLALAQRQAEMASIDARIAQLQGRLQRKRALNQRLSQQLAAQPQPPSQGPGRSPNYAVEGNSPNVTSGTTTTPTSVTGGNPKLEFGSGGKPRPAGNIAAIEPYSHIPNDNDFGLNKNDPKYQTLPYNTKFTVNFKASEDDVNKNKIQHSASASQIGQRGPNFQQYGHQIAHSQSQSHIQGQSQPLNVNQTQQQINTPNQPSSQTLNNNANNNNNNIINNNNNNNNNNAANHNFQGDNNQTSTQSVRLLAHQLQNSGQQKQQQHGSTTSTSSSLSSANQNNQNHRNLQMHQKPVSSVAPSFPVKSPIYQTSSTKIHPVMPQTLSLIGRGHPASQSYAANINAQNQNRDLGQGMQNGQQLQQQQDSNFPSRHNYPVSVSQQQQQQQSGSQHVPTSVANTYQSQNSPNLPSSGGGSAFAGYGYSSTTQSGLEERLKIPDKMPGIEQQARFDQNLLGKYEVQQAKYEPHTQPIKLFDHSSGNKHEHTSKLQQQQQLEHNSQVFKHEPQQFKCEPNQSKFDHLTTRYEQQHSVKHDHGAKFEPPSKLPEKPFDYERKVTGEAKPELDKTKPALPPKPSKPNPPPRLTQHHDKIEVSPELTDVKPSIILPSRTEKEEETIPPIPTSEPPESPTESQLTSQQQQLHQVIKSRPLSLKKAPLSEQPKLRYAKSNVHVSINRRIEMPPAFLFPETEIPADLMQTDQQQSQQQVQQTQQQQQQQQPPQPIDVTDSNAIKRLIVNPVTVDDVTCNEKLEDSDIIDALNVINIEDHKLKSETIEIDGGKPAADVIRRKKGNLKSTTGKANLSRRVSFDPLALLLDASLEGELELVKKTAKEVANPSSANDEGITALHNAICAGHLEIVKFLVEFGCDVNAQDSDGWTPLHCAASCNNLAMVRFLVEHGACIFATTLSDHETAAEKCEEDEEGFDGCSEYLYSVQEKLGIMNNGQVYAVFDYDAQHSDELSLKNGDSLVILRKGDDNEREWWWSKLGHREGYVPRNLLGLYPRVQPAKAD